MFYEIINFDNLGVKGVSIILVVIFIIPKLIKKNRGVRKNDCKRRIFKQIKKIFWFKPV